MIRILVADDDAFSRRYLEATLRGAGWSVDTVADGLAAWSALEHPDARFDILITDVRMPGLSGIDLIARIRERAAAIGIIAVSAMGSDEQIVAGLEAGADDYLAKPVSSAILLAKIRAALRRAQGPGTGAEVGLLEVGPLRMDRGAATVTKDGHPVALTRTEYELLAFLMLNRGRIVSPTQILSTVWGEAYESDTEILRAAIVRLRRKIEDDPAAPTLLRTHIGFGYSLGVPR